MAPWLINAFVRHAGMWLMVWTLALAALTVPSQAQEAAGEAAAKARFSITLARFVRWPATGASTLRMCVVQHSPAVAAAFAAYDGSLLSGRTVTVVQNPPSPAAQCDLIFVDGSGHHAPLAWLDVAADLPVLTLGAVDGFLGQGGMIELVNVNDALRFDVNLSALRGAGLSLSSQALKLARQVRE